MGLFSVPCGDSQYVIIINIINRTTVCRIFKVSISLIFTPPITIHPVPIKHPILLFKCMPPDTILKMPKTSIKINVSVKIDKYNAKSRMRPIIHTSLQQNFNSQLHFCKFNFFTGYEFSKVLCNFICNVFQNHFHLLMLNYILSSVFINKTRIKREIWNHIRFRKTEIMQIATFIILSCNKNNIRYNEFIILNI